MQPERGLAALASDQLADGRHALAGRRDADGTSKRAGTNWLPATAAVSRLAHVDRHAHAQRVHRRAVRLVIAAESAGDARDERVVQLSPHAPRRRLQAIHGHG